MSRQIAHVPVPQMREYTVEVVNVSQKCCVSERIYILEQCFSCASAPKVDVRNNFTLEILGRSCNMSLDVDMCGSLNVCLFFEWRT